MIALVLMPERECTICTKRQQKDWGCHARQKPDGTWEQKSRTPNVIEGEERWDCPRRPVKDEPSEWNAMLRHFQMFKKGHFADGGAMNDQAAFYVDLMQLIGTTVAQCEAEEAAKPRVRHSDGR